MNDRFDVSDIITRFLKYVFSGLMLVYVAYVLDLIGPSKLNITEISVLALTVASTYALLDLLLPCK